MPCGDDFAAGMVKTRMGRHALSGNAASEAHFL